MIRPDLSRDPEVARATQDINKQIAEKEQRQAEEKAKREAEEKAKRAAEEKAKREAEERPKRQPVLRLVKREPVLPEEPDESVVSADPSEPEESEPEESEPEESESEKSEPEESESESAPTREEFLRQLAEVDGALAIMRVLQTLPEAKDREEFFPLVVHTLADVPHSAEREQWIRVARQTFPHIDRQILINRVNDEERRLKRVREKSQQQAEFERMPSDLDLTPDPWEHIETVDALLAREDPVVEEIEPRVLLRGSVTEIAAPRGLGKSNYAHWLAVKLSKRGVRVLLIDRDNSTRLLKRRLRSWGAADTPTLKYIGREHTPSLFDKEGWAKFPEGYDVVIVDSLYSAAEGLDEKNTGRASRAMASMLDLARRANGPAILVLNNTTRDAKASRGSGVIEDRGDITYEVRDMTGYHFTGKKAWHEEVAEIPAGAAEWARRITRRKGATVYRLAFCCTKYRDDVEPTPFVYEIDHRPEVWTITEVTEQIEHGSTAALHQYQEREGLACAALIAQVRHKHAGGLPLKKIEAIELLRQHHLSRNDAEALLERGVGKHWRIEVQSDKHGQPKVLRPLDIPSAQSFTRSPAHEEGD